MDKSVNQHRCDSEAEAECACQIIHIIIESHWLRTVTITGSSDEVFLAACLSIYNVCFSFFPSRCLSVIFVGGAVVWAAHRSILGLATADLRSTDIPTSNSC